MAAAKHKAGLLSLRRFDQAICEKEAYAQNFYQQRKGPRNAHNFVISFVLRQAMSIRINASLNNAIIAISPVAISVSLAANVI